MWKLTFFLQVSKTSACLSYQSSIKVKMRMGRKILTAGTKVFEENHVQGAILPSINATRNDLGSNPDHSRTHSCHVMALPWRLEVIYKIHFVPHREQFASIRKINRWMLYRKTFAVSCKKHTEHKYTLKDNKVLSVKRSETYSKHYLKELISLTHTSVCLPIAVLYATVCFIPPTYSKYIFFCFNCRNNGGCSVRWDPSFITFSTFSASPPPPNI